MATAASDPRRRSQLLVGLALSAAGAALFSTKAIFIKLAYREIADASLLLATRMVLSLPFFLAVGVFASRRGLPETALGRRGIVFRAALTGFLGYYIAALLDFEGLVYISAQLERLVLFTYPMFVMFLGWAFFGGRLTLRGIAAAAITYAGLAIVFYGGAGDDFETTLWGTILVLGAAVSFALYQLLAKGFIALLGSALFTSIAMSAASLASVAHVLLFGDVDPGRLSAHYLALAAATAVFATVIPAFLMNAGVGRIGAQSAAMISTLSPLVTIYLAVLFLDEVFTIRDGIGTVFVLGGVGLYSLWEVRSLRERPG
jgi:drug/metabolite transporter (DMT)-like permease